MMPLNQNNMFKKLFKSTIKAAVKEVFTTILRKLTANGVISQQTKTDIDKAFNDINLDELI